jgi:hypothetical protein
MIKLGLSSFIKVVVRYVNFPIIRIVIIGFTFDDNDILCKLKLVKF